MADIANRDYNPSEDELRSAYLACLKMCRKLKVSQYDIEIQSLANWAVVQGWKRWQLGLGPSFDKYVVHVFARIVCVYKRKKPDEEFDEQTFIPRRMLRDDGQRLLLRFPEPALSICHGVWIEGRPVTWAVETFDMNRAAVEDLLEHYAIKLIILWEDNHESTRL